MSRIEYGIYELSKVMAVLVTCLAAFCQFVRFTDLLGHGPVHGWLLDLTFLALFVAPLLLMWGIGLTLFLRLRSRSGEAVQKPRASLLVFVVCGVIWFCAAYTFQLVPFFLGENRVPRLFIDDWLDMLL